MVIRLDENYNAMASTALLGYVGETNARPVSVEGMEIDGADRYVMTIDYGDGVTYEVDITGGQWTPTADILRSAQTVSCQIAAKKLSGDEYILVKKSRIFRLRIGAAIGDTAIPSPSVAADALDRIDAIGRQTHADMQTAVTAAETATTAAENAEKSATTAGVSADTATQAASRAETAKTAAETSATQAETAKQGAETARAEAVKSQNDAKVSAAQASTAAQQTEADKTITAGYAKTAKTNADSTAADRQAVQTLAEQVTTDKATVADHAAQVATDRKTAETAAQTAQAVADSLPDDYVTAVGKIAENTAEIGRVKLTDKELQRRVNALYDIGQGVTHKFETDTDTAYTKTVPTGAKLMSVKSIGGHSEAIDGEIISAGVIEVAVGDTACPIPEAIKALPGYGWSAGTARNYVDYENKRYVQCVGSVDLGTLTWMKTSSQSVGDYFYASVSAIGFKRLGAFGITVHNILCSKYITVARNPNAFVDKTIVLDGDSIAVSQIQVKDTAYTDATAFKQAMSGVMLYYELANPIVTDISSLIPDDFLRNIEVEAGGSITFKNSNDNYHIPVPSEEEYIVKLSEVGGTA
ncbi:hypothetical protein [Ruminococcus bicirculans (ex Wegman et al. 2014)]|uniref:hypothetical protein n=1 Tax=Ruminococcus bicirculans (ex Wegman et al. 2014) TaxID=1160721 RepID=UPI0039905CFE